MYYEVVMGGGGLRVKFLSKAGSIESDGGQKNCQYRTTFTGNVITFTVSYFSSNIFNFFKKISIVKNIIYFTWQLPKVFEMSHWSDHTGYDVTYYIRSEVTAKNCRKYRLRRLRVKFLTKGLSNDHDRNCTHLSGTIGLTNLPDMTSLAASGRLQNATIKYCANVRKPGPAGQRVDN